MMQEALKSFWDVAFRDHPESLDPKALHANSPNVPSSSYSEPELFGVSIDCPSSSPLPTPSTVDSANLPPTQTSSPSNDDIRLDRKLSVKEKAKNENGRFICGVCHKKYARRDRMEICKNNHRNYKAYPCHGGCGKKEWYFFIFF